LAILGPLALLATFREPLSAHGVDLGSGLSLFCSGPVPVPVPEGSNGKRPMADRAEWIVQLESNHRLPHGAHAPSNGRQSPAFRARARARGNLNSGTDPRPSPLATVASRREPRGLRGALLAHERPTLRKGAPHCNTSPTRSVASAQKETRDPWRARVPGFTCSGGRRGPSQPISPVGRSQRADPWGPGPS